MTIFSKGHGIVSVPMKPNDYLKEQLNLKHEDKIVIVLTCIKSIRRINISDYFISFSQYINDYFNSFILM